MEEKLENLKNDFENMKQSYKRSSCKNDSNVCENCESLEKKIHYLVKTVDKLSKGKSHFEIVLASQNCVLGNLDWGLIHRARRVVFLSLVQLSGNFNQLKNRNNQLLLASIV